MSWIAGMIGWFFGAGAGGIVGEMLGSSWTATSRDVEAAGQDLMYGRGGILYTAGCVFGSCFFATIAGLCFVGAESAGITIVTSVIAGLALMVCTAISAGRRKRRRPNW
jgi:hypothetical protein